MTRNEEGKGLSHPSLSAFFADLSPVNSFHAAVMQEPVLGFFPSLSMHKHPFVTHKSQQANPEEQSNAAHHPQRGAEESQMPYIQNHSQSSPYHDLKSVIGLTIPSKGGFPKFLSFFLFCSLFIVARTLNTRSTLSNFIGTMLYSTSLDFIHLT